MTGARELLHCLRDLYASHVTQYFGRDNSLVREPLTDEVLLGHLDGRWRVGTYFDPGDGTVLLGVIDLDNEKDPEGEKPHAKRAVEWLAELGIRAEIFSSKGKGYHVPAYFAEPVPAWAVRKVLGHAAKKADRPGAEIFPKQDKVDVYIPPAGSDDSARVGSYINLPFHGLDLPHGRTALLDKGNGLDPAPDQLAAVEGIKKNSLESLTAALATIGDTSPPPARKAAPPLAAKLTTGQRRPALFSFAGTMRRRGATADEILPALNAMNAARCEPVLPDEDIRKLALGTERYEPADPLTAATEEAARLSDPRRWNAKTVIDAKEKVIISSSNPLGTARKLIKANLQHEGQNTLVHQAGQFFGWDGKCYTSVDDDTIRAHTYRFLEMAKAWDENKTLIDFRPNRSRVGEVFDAMKALANLPSSTAAPAWLDCEAPVPPEEIFAAANGLLHLPTLELLPHTPNYYSHNAVDYPFSPGVGEPIHLHKFFDAIFDDDIHAREALQELFGYSLTGDTRQQKIFLIVGPKRSGKGTIARVLTALLGQTNVCAPTLANFGTNFGLAPLIGKRAAIIADARLGGKADQSAVAERLLSISGEDSITVDRKFRPAWTGRLGVRFILLSNELPRIADASGALASRFIVWTLTESFYGKEDHGLTDRLLSELPAILNWAIVGWRRLRERGYFVQPSSSLEAIQELEDLGSPIKAFLRERCEVKAGAEVEVEALFSAWQQWCKDQGRDHTGNLQSFGRDLRAALPKIRDTRPREGEVRVRKYSGLRLLAAWESVRSGPRT